MLGPRKQMAEEDGLETLEFVGLFPLVILSIAIVWQFILVGYAGIIAAGAAREGARAAAVDANVPAAVAAASPGLECRVEDWTPHGTMRSVTVACRVPKAPLPFIQNVEYPWVRSTATMRYEYPFTRPP